MEWHERMFTSIKVGEKYENRDGDECTVIEKREDNTGKSFFEISSNTWLGNYMVGELGGFGIYPNGYDLVKKII